MGAPKQIVPPFNKKDIIAIVNDGITNGDVAIPTPEGGTKLYKHTIATSNANIVIISKSATPYEHLPTYPGASYDGNIVSIISAMGNVDYKAVLQTASIGGTGEMVAFLYTGGGSLSTSQVMGTYGEITDTVTEL